MYTTFILYSHYFLIIIIPKLSLYFSFYIFYILFLLFQSLKGFKKMRYYKKDVYRNCCRILHVEKVKMYAIIFYLNIN